MPGDLDLTAVNYRNAIDFVKLNAGFSRLSASALMNKAGIIVASLTGNAKFPTPVPALGLIDAAIDALGHAMSTYGPARTTAVAGCHRALAALLQELATHLMGTPDVIEADLASTGFDLPRPHTRSEALPPAPGNLRLKLGPHSMEVIPMCDAVTSIGVRVYEVEWTLDPNHGPWIHGGIHPHSRAMLVAGLPRAKDIWMRVRAIGTRGPGSWSDPATILVS